MRSVLRLLLSATLVAACSGDADEAPASASEAASAAPDATAVGPGAVTSAEYRFPARRDPGIVADADTELWARVYRPTELGASPHPLLVFLHGNHGTCGHGTAPREDDSVQYTNLGTCPDGYEVVPNHLGYGYVAERLASWGYVVVSINANRGITGSAGDAADFGLNLARGRLVLTHLAMLSRWNAEPGTTPASVGVDLAGALDFGAVGLMGHSRGGEGVRAAYAQYHDPGSPWPARFATPLDVRGIFEIGPVDGQTNRVLDAVGTSWAVLLPMCDGDVLDLEGMRPFDRMLAVRPGAEAAGRAKGLFAVWGANHNFFNTEWQTNESIYGCDGPGNLPLFEADGTVGSPRQRETGLHAMLAFFRAHVGRDAAPGLGRALAPQFDLPPALRAITRVERAYSEGASTDDGILVEDFTGPTGTSKAGLPTIAHGVEVLHRAVAEHDPSLRAAAITWHAAAPSTTFEVDFTQAHEGLDVHGMTSLDLRVSLQGGARRRTGATTSFAIELVDAAGTSSIPVRLRDWFELAPPVGSAFTGAHITLDTARIPLAAFGDVATHPLRGARLVFDDTSSGAIWVTGLRFARADLAAVGPRQRQPSGAVPRDGATAPKRATLRGRLAAVRRHPNDAGADFEVFSDTKFPVTDALPRLRIGAADVVGARYPEAGDTRTLVFPVDDRVFAFARERAAGAPLTVEVGGAVYDLGAFSEP